MDGPALLGVKSLLHNVASGLLFPAIIILLFFLALAVVELGGLLVEIPREYRRRKVDVAQVMVAWQGQNAEEIREGIAQSQLCQRQKAALSQLVLPARLPAASRRALARRILAAEERHYAKITDRTDLVARLAPMLGLMGTLIPLGPGIIALGQGDIQTLGGSLLVAFDTTVAGLAASGIAYATSRLRKRWYRDRLDTLTALLESLLEVFADGWGAAE